MYLPGHAGNLINRLISLSPETIPQVSITELKKSVIDTGQAPNVGNRLELYSFKQSQKYPTWQDFHRDCADFYNRSLFEHFNNLFSPGFLHVVYAIHPWEFELHRKDIDQLSTAEFLVIVLDSKYNQWVEYAQTKLNFQYRNDEIKLYHKIKQEYNMHPINLDKMLDSIDGFKEEYLSVVSKLNLTPCLDQAILLFENWYAFRGPNLQK
jgi:hypothetical protein